jgi:hypothetical protein
MVVKKNWDGDVAPVYNTKSTSEKNTSFFSLLIMGSFSVSPEEEQTCTVDQLKVKVQTTTTNEQQGGDKRNER